MESGIWFELTILMGLAVASHFIVTKFGQPLVVGEIVLGIFIGPSILGFITDTNLISQFAQLGALILLFSIGLECNIREIYTKESIVIATCGVVVPWIGGYIFGISVGHDFSTSVFIGAIMVATSVAVTAQILVEMGQIGSRVGKTIVGAAVVDDILGMIILTLSLGFSENYIDLPHIILLVVGAALFIVVGSYIGVKYLSRVILFIENHTRKVEHSGFLFALAIMFLYAFISERIGISAIVGAFVAGTMFPTVSKKKEFHEGTKFLSSVFTPIFFISIGIMVNFSGLKGYYIILFGILLTLIAILTKVIGCAIPAKFLGMSAKESLTVGYGMAPRCEVALAIAMLGLSLNLIAQDLYFMAVFMAILTTILTPPVLKFLLKREKKKRKKEELIRAISTSKRKVK